MSDSPWRSPRSARCASPARHESPLRGSPWSRTAPRAAWSDCQWTPSSPGTSEATAGAPPRAAGIRCKPPEAAYLGGGRTRNAFSEERIRQNRSMNITANTSWLWLNPKNNKSFPFLKKESQSFGEEIKLELWESLLTGTVLAEVRVNSGVWVEVLLMDSGSVKRESFLSEAHLSALLAAHRL